MTGETAEPGSAATSHDPAGADQRDPTRRRAGAPTAAITDQHLAALSSDERARLAQRLAELAAATAPAARWPAHRRWLAVLALGGCLAMVPWTALLAITLPERYVTQHWSVTWVGFDTLLLISFAATAWATWRHHRTAWVATAVTATLLGCDAWFDITTASTTSDLVLSTITAAAGELPLAAVLIYLARRPISGRPRRLSSRVQPEA